MALPAALLVLLLVAASAASFVRFMNQAQTSSGARLRESAARALAEAGAHRALSILETTTPDGTSPGRDWRPTAYVETRQVGPWEGRIVLSAADRTGGDIVLTSAGEVAGVARRLRATVHLASPVLRTGLFAPGYLWLERRTSATYVLPYGSRGADRPWFHAAVGRGLLLIDRVAALNPTGTEPDMGTGPVDLPTIVHAKSNHPDPEPMRLLLGPGADVMMGRDHVRLRDQEVRALGLPVAEIVRHGGPLPAAPEIDREFLRAEAAANFANAGLNAAAGEYLQEPVLSRKRDSLYSAAQFRRLQEYFDLSRRQSPLAAIIYVAGDMVVRGNRQIGIADGALIVEGNVQVTQGASLEIRHSNTTRGMPGLIVLGRGRLVVTDGGRLRVHGVVFADGTIAVGTDGLMDVIGAVIAGDPVLGLRNFGGKVMIRYDPAVLGTPGLRVPPDSPVIAWVTSWEEQP